MINSACPNCQAVGLPILPLRYAVAPKYFRHFGLGSFSAEQVKDVALTENQYIVRTLRAGYLYLYYEKGPYAAADYWEVFSVAPDGQMVRQLSPARALPISEINCSRKGHDTQRLQYIVIERPEQCGTVWMAFSEHKWGPETIARYQGLSAEKKSARAARMQPIEPAQWVAGNASAKNHQMILADENNIKRCAVEYGGLDLPTESLTGEMTDLPNMGLYRNWKVSTDKGDIDSQVLGQCMTRYPWYLRNQPAINVPDARIKSLYKQMEAKCLATADPGKGPVHWPMAIALWDAVGVVHELAGFRNDAAFWWLKYQDEREMEIDAISMIGGAKAALEKNEAAMADRLIEGRTQHALHVERMQRRGLIGRYFRATGPEGPQLRELDEQFMAGTVPEQDYLSRREALIRAGVPAKDVSEALAGFSNLDNYRKNSLGHQSGQERMKREMVNDTWPKYEVLVDRKALEAFQAKFEAAKKKVDELQAKRTPDLDAWLKAPLFLSTLNDYHDGDVEDAPKFNDVIEIALDGLLSEPSGEAVLGSLVGNLQVTAPESLYWRNIALNQKEAKQELQQLLTLAEGQKSQLLGIVGTGWNLFTQGAGHLKKFTKYYKEYYEILKRDKPKGVKEEIVKELGVDRYMVATGALVFKKLRIDQLGDFVGEKLLQHVFMIRAHVSAEDSIELIKKQAEHDPFIRRLFLERMEHHISLGATSVAAYPLAMADVAESQASRVMRVEWNKIKVSEGGDAAKFALRIATLTAVLEAVNFAKLLSKSDKTRKDYALLVASGMGTVGAFLAIASEPTKQLFKEASRSVTNLRAVSGYLTGLAAIINVFLDAASAADSRRREQNLLALGYILKVLIGWANATAMLVVAISSSTPLLQRYGGRTVTVVFLERVLGGVAVATAQKKATDAAGVLALEAAKKAAPRALIGLGRVLLYLTGWEIAAAVTATQVLIWIFSPTALQDWVVQSAFGTARDKFPSAQKQEAAYKKALEDMRLTSDATN